MRLRRLLLTTLLVASVGLVAAAQTSRPATPVTLMQLPLKLPAIGNLEGVKKWRFGRIEQIERVSGTSDILLNIRVMGGRVLRVPAPAAPLAELATQSNWVTSGNAGPGRSDYVERMIAFDVDAQSRLIAMMSLEPVERSRNRLRRALR